MSGEAERDASDDPPRLPPWQSFREALEAAGFRPTKTRGQNFLVDTNMARAIAADAPFRRGDFVLEVGPGCGMLSVPLAARGARLFAVEVEPRLAAIAERFLAPYPQARVHVGDVLAGKSRLAPEVLAQLPTEGDWHVAANLPYAIVGPLLVLLSQLDPAPKSITALVQLELAERVAAPPGDTERGALSVRLQARYQARVGRRVGRQLFRPRPRVESAVLELRRRADVSHDPQELDAFDALALELFSQRRKAVAGRLRRLLGVDDAFLEAHGVEAGARPADLDERVFWSLARTPAWQAGRGHVEKKS